MDVSDCAADERSGSLDSRVDGRGQTELVTVIQARSGQTTAVDDAPETLYRDSFGIAKPKPPRQRVRQRNFDDAATEHPIEAYVSVSDVNCVDDLAHARVLDLTRQSSAAASETDCGCGFTGFSHVKTG